MSTVTGGDVDVVRLDGLSLGVEEVARAAIRGGARHELSPEAAEAMWRSREVKRSLVERGAAVYGVTTGFGDSVGTHVRPGATAELQRNLIRYHLTGTGPAAPPEVVRATLLIRANCLARGVSGVRPVVVERLLALLRHDVLPEVPSRGSVGASGDLVPLCYVAAALIGEGRVVHRGVVRPSAEVLAELGLAPLELEAKEGLALINGTSFSAAWAVLAVAEAAELARVADLCTALATEALLGHHGHFAGFVHRHKPHPGQVASAGAVAAALAGSGLTVGRDAVVTGDGRRWAARIQDRYSIRCAPHVVGVLRDTLEWAGRWLAVEVNCANDNPLFDADGDEVFSGGNFYGGHIAQAADSLKVAVANVADLLDRQVALLVDEKFNNGLTANLVPADDESGVHHGYKGAQITCSALTAEALSLCTPSSAFSRSTEAHNQDKVSIAPVAARQARAVVELAREVAAIQLLTACQALDVRGGVPLMASGTRAVHEAVRRLSPFVAGDRRLDGDIAGVVGLIRSGDLTGEGGRAD